MATFTGRLPTLRHQVVKKPKLLPFAGDEVAATGKIYQRGGSKATVIDKIEVQTAQKEKFKGKAMQRRQWARQLVYPALPTFHQNALPSTA